MPKQPIPRPRRRRPVLLEPPALDARPAAPAGDIESSTEVLESLLEAFGGDGGMTVAVERKRNTRGQGGYLSTHDVTDGLLDEVKAQYGGGEYRGRVYRGGKYLTSINFAIAGPPKEPRVVAAATPESDEGMTAIAAVLATIAADQREMMQEFRRRAEPARNGLDDVVKVAQALRELAPPPAPVAAPVDPYVSLEHFLKAQSLLAELQPREGTDFSAIVRDGVTPLVGVLNRKIDLDRETMNRRRLPAPPAQPIGGTDALSQLAAQIPDMARGYLARCAQQEKDPELYADLVLDQLPGDVVDGLPVLLADEDVAARLCILVPQWAPHRAWIGELVNGMRARLTDETTDDERDTGAADLTAEAAG